MSDNPIVILNATAEDFAVEVVDSLPSGDGHRDGRIVKYLTHIYVWDGSSWVKFANESDVAALSTNIVTHSALASTEMSVLASREVVLQAAIDAEELAMPSAVLSQSTSAQVQEGLLSDELSVAISARESAIDSLEVRSSSELSQVGDDRAAMVTAISGELSSEVSRAQSVEVVLSNAVEAQVSKQLEEDADLDSALSTELSSEVAQQALKTSALTSAVASRQSEDASVNTRLTALEGNLDAILVAGNLGIDTFVEAVSAIASTDAAHDAQFDEQWSIVTDARDNAIASRIDDFSGANQLDDQLSSEISSEVLADSSLQTLIASVTSDREASVQAKQDVLDSLELERSQEYSAIQSGILSTKTIAESNHAGHLTSIASLTTARLSVHSDLEDELSVAKAARISDFSDLQDALDAEELAMPSAIVVLSTAEALGSTTLSTNLSSEISSQVEEDSVLQSALDAEEATYATASGNLSSELSVELSEELSMRTSLVAELASVETSMQDRESVMLSAIQSVESRTDAMLQGALSDDQGEVVDNFSEVLSMINAIEDGTDSAMLSYVTAFGADGSVGEIEDDRIAGDADAQTSLTSAIDARTSTMTVIEDAESVSIAATSAAIGSLEVRENSRHKRVNFGGTWASQNKVTSFTVSKEEWTDSDFRLNENGMVQIFQQVTETTFRNLVAPIQIDADGNITVQLGTVPKLGFALFYSFGKEDDTSALSSPSSAPAWELYSNLPPYTAPSDWSESNPTVYSDFTPVTDLEIAESFGDASIASGQFYIGRLDGAEYVDQSSDPAYPYYGWSVPVPEATTDDDYTTIDFTYIQWGADGETCKIRWYAEESTDGGVTWGAAEYHDVTFTINQYNSGGLGNSTAVSFPITDDMGSVALPSSPTVGAAYKLYAEGYNSSDELVFTVGSSSSPYYVLATDHDFKMYPAAVGYPSEYWHPDGESATNSGISSVFGQTRSFTLSNPSSVSAGGTYSDSIATFNANNSGSFYGWTPYDTDWVLSGTDVALFDLKNNDSGDQSSADDSEYISLYFKEGPGGPYGYDRPVPSAGTYNVTLTASNAGGADVVWNITFVIS